MSILNVLDKTCREGNSPNTVDMFTSQTNPFNNIVKNVVRFSWKVYKSVHGILFYTYPRKVFYYRSLGKSIALSYLFYESCQKWRQRIVPDDLLGYDGDEWKNFKGVDQSNFVQIHTI